ncbi:MAG: DNA polymerase subunit beta [Crenarchaeota archaeon]|nr:DNA polymerase subunit beta [Thermoproteota archaeon]
MAIKPKRHIVDSKEVIYSSEHWQELSFFRQKAATILNELENHHLQPIVYGSIARGDVKTTSDIDIFLPDISSSFQLETILEHAKIQVISRSVIQATPLHAMKAYLEIDATTTVSFPLMPLRRVEREFYKFSGEANLKKLENNQRVAGIDKRLMLIDPIQKGHIESSVLGNEEYVAKKLGINIETVKNRTRALLRRDLIGRTGVFVKKELAPDDTFELVLKKIAEVNPAVRRRLG